MDLDSLIQEMTKTARDMWERGWAEANGGNISLRLNPEQRACVEGLTPERDWQPIPVTVPGMANERFLLTGAGRYLRNVELAPEENLGVIEVDEEGARYRILWGFEPAGEPTSELGAHLLSHAAIGARSGGVEHVVIHSHTPNLIALTYAVENLTTSSLTRLLWQMHAECVFFFPGGIEFLPWKMSASVEFSRAMAEALGRRPLALWEFHGAFAAGRDLDETFGRIHVAEKTAGMYLTVMAAGGVKQRLSDAQIRAIAEHFDRPIDTSLFDE